MSNIPFMYDYQNVVNSVVTPSTVHVQGSTLSRFFQRYLLQKTMSVFKWEMPETWSKEFFLYNLYCRGFVCVLKTAKFGVIPQGCGLKGYDVFYRPKSAYVVNPLFPSPLELDINKDCILFRLQPDYGGVMDLVTFYGDMMALCAETIGTNLLNSKLSYVFTADNKTAAESFKKLFDRVASGEPAVVQDKNLTRSDGQPAWQSFAQNLNQTYIADKILADMSRIEAMFDTEIGIPNANVDKKERLITDEVNSNNVETASKCSMWLDSLKLNCRQVGDMFGVSMSVDWRVKPVELQERGDTDEIDN